MFNKKLTLEILQQIDQSLSIVLNRFSVIKSVNDFLESDSGLEKLDSICMKLIAVGESFKNIDKHTDNQLMQNYPDIDWKGVKGIRDIISHHYFDVDAEEIFEICKSQIQPLHATLQKMIIDVRESLL